MKLLVSCVLLTFAACQVPANIDIPSVAREIVVQLDRDGDGIVSKEEIRRSKDDPTFWVGMSGVIMGLLGLFKSARAQQVAQQVQVETDQQWDNELSRLRARNEATRAPQ